MFPTPAGPFAAGLKILAEAIVEGLGLRVGYVTLGGFDTHANQQATHDNLLKTLADGVYAFYSDLAHHGGLLLWRRCPPCAHWAAGKEDL